ncbi:peptide-methionine (R)-S-oxide reductase MsrB [Flavobacteriaceae bacterium GSB9]|nr:peptide-methionine (R)-S-oxide reductase MsrB [Flavobacteriaceae bacterium GSB9]
MKRIALFALLSLFLNCEGNTQKKKTPKFKVTKTETEWKSELTEMEFYVLRKAGTEPAFSSPLNKNYSAGTYVCAGCQTPLFKSEHKFDSGSGWPSFDREIKGNVAFSTDQKLGYPRTEEHCATCGGHLGHVFNDGPKNTTGKRHCINGVALDFIPKEK